MTAREMFEKLGYKYSPSHLTKIRYEKEEDGYIYHYIFNEKTKHFSKTKDYGKTHIEFYEMPAINKQLEELSV